MLNILNYCDFMILTFNIIIRQYLFRFVSGKNCEMHASLDLFPCFLLVINVNVIIQSNVKQQITL